MIDFALIQNSIPALLKGIFETLKITFGSLSLGFLIGSFLGSLEFSAKSWLKILIRIYVTIFRGTPMLVQLAFLYFLLPSIGVHLSNLSCCILAIGLNSAAYVSQIVKSGLMAINQDEIEAAKVLGLKPLQIWIFIMIPQTFRNILPSLTNESITLLKDSSLASTIGVSEVYKELKSILSSSYDIATVFFLMTIIYLTLTTMISYLSYYFEKRFSYARD